MLFAHFNILVVNYDKYMQSIKMHNYYTKYKMDIAIKSMQHKKYPGKYFRKLAAIFERYL